MEFSLEVNCLYWLLNSFCVFSANWLQKEYISKDKLLKTETIKLWPERTRSDQLTVKYNMIFRILSINIW